MSETQTPAYTPEQLADMHEQANATREWKNQKGETENLTQYEASQRMRRMENAMRKTRSRAAAFKAAESMDDYRAQKVKYTAQRAEYKSFCRAMGLQKQLSRVYSDGIGRI